MKHVLKTLIPITILTLLIIGISIYTQRVLYKTSTDLGDSLSKVESSTTSQDWKSAENNLQDIKNKWSNIKATWAILIDHQEIDNIDVTLSRTEKFVQSKDSSSALAEASALMKFIKHIPDKETLSIRNVF